MIAHQIDLLMTPWIINGSAFLGTAEFYKAGTNTAYTVYSDSIGNGPSTIRSFESDGTIKAYADGEFDLKIIIKDQSGSVIKTYDNIYYKRLTQTVLDQAIKIDGSSIVAAAIPFNHQNITNVKTIDVETLKINRGGSFGSIHAHDAVFMASQLGDVSFRINNNNLEIYVNGVLSGTFTQTGLSLDHDKLTGLGDDDHTQYINNSRGDSRYILRNAPVAQNGWFYVSNNIEATGRIIAGGQLESATGLQLGNSVKIQSGPDLLNVRTSANVDSFSVGTSVNVFSKKIINVSNGTNTNDAINFGQHSALDTLHDALRVEFDALDYYTRVLLITGRRDLYVANVASGAADGTSSFSPMSWANFINTYSIPRSAGNLGLPLVSPRINLVLLDNNYPDSASGDREFVYLDLWITSPYTYIQIFDSLNFRGCHLTFNMGSGYVEFRNANFSFVDTTLSAPALDLSFTTPYTVLVSENSNINVYNLTVGNITCSASKIRVNNQFYWYLALARFDKASDVWAESLFAIQVTTILAIGGTDVVFNSKTFGGSVTITADASSRILEY